MTRPDLELRSLTKVPALHKPSFQVLPNATASSMAGLLEFVQNRGDSADPYHLADELTMEADNLLPVLDGAVLLRFVTSNAGGLQITSAGKEFVEADIATGKTLFRESALSHLTLIQQIEGQWRRFTCVSHTFER